MLKKFSSFPIMKKFFDQKREKPTLGADLPALAADRQVETLPSDNHRRRTLVVTRHNGAWGFTVQSFADKDNLKPQCADIGDLTFVNCVDLHGAAFIAGLRKGDVILSINGTSTESMSYNDIVNTLETSGDTIRLVVLHENNLKKIILHFRYIKYKKILAVKQTELQSLEDKIQRLQAPRTPNKRETSTKCLTPTLSCPSLWNDCWNLSPKTTACSRKRAGSKTRVSMSNISSDPTEVGSPKVAIMDINGNLEKAKRVDDGREVSQEQGRGHRDSVCSSLFSSDAPVNQRSTKRTSTPVLRDFLDESSEFLCESMTTISMTSSECNRRQSLAQLQAPAGNFKSKFESMASHESYISPHMPQRRASMISSTGSASFYSCWDLTSTTNDNKPVIIESMEQPQEFSPRLVAHEAALQSKSSRMSDLQMNAHNQLLSQSNTAPPSVSKLASVREHTQQAPRPLARAGSCYVLAPSPRSRSRSSLGSSCSYMSISSGETVEL